MIPTSCNRLALSFRKASQLSRTFCIDIPSVLTKGSLMNRPPSPASADAPSSFLGQVRSPFPFTSPISGGMTGPCMSTVADGRPFSSDSAMKISKVAKSPRRKRFMMHCRSFAFIMCIMGWWVEEASPTMRERRARMATRERGRRGRHRRRDDRADDELGEFSRTIVRFCSVAGPCCYFFGSDLTPLSRTTISPPINYCPSNSPYDNPTAQKKRYRGERAASKNCWCEG